MKPTTTTCSINNKVCYLTYREAEKALDYVSKSIAMKENVVKNVRSIYQFKHCKFYHLTSLNKKQSRKLSGIKSIIKKPTPTLIEKRLDFLKNKNKGC